MDRNGYVLDYYDQNGKKLHTLVDKIIRKYGGITDPDHYYSLANEIFVQVLKGYDGEQSFDGFLYSCLEKKIKTEKTRQNRDKRMQYARDKNGNKVKDNEGNFIRIHNIYLDAPIDIEGESSLTVGDTIESDFNIDKEVFEKNVQDGSKVDMFMKRLSKKEQRIVEMCVSGYKPFEIREALHITQKQYANYMEDIRSYENISILF